MAPEAMTLFGMQIGSYTCSCISDDAVNRDDFIVSVAFGEDAARASKSSGSKARAGHAGSQPLGGSAKLPTLLPKVNPRVAAGERPAWLGAAPKTPLNGEPIAEHKRPLFLPDASALDSPKPCGGQPHDGTRTFDEKDPGDREASESGVEWESMGADESSRLERFWSVLSQPELARTPKLRPTFRRPTVSFKEDQPLPSFTGRWLLTSIEGDFDSFLKDIGVGWALRRMAHGFGYGVNKQLQDILQDDNEFTLITEGGPRRISMTASIGGEESLSTGLDGEPNYVTLSWSDGCLKTESRNKHGKSSPPTFRYMLGETMVVETTTGEGKVVKRFFTKKGNTNQAPKDTSKDAPAVRGD